MVRMKRRVVPRFKGDRTQRKLLGAFLSLVGAVVLLVNVPFWIWLSLAGAGLAWLGAVMYSKP
jgi:drug/metabolite transporter (DMT)-like permease